MDSELLDLIARTRPTILEILENRGFNVDAHKNTSPEELIKLAMANVSLLNFRIEHNEGGKTCHVLYFVDSPIRLKVENMVNKLWDPENPDGFDPAKDEVIGILYEPFHDVFSLQSIKTWNRIKARMTFFHIKNLVSNPAKHAMVPPHRKLSDEESKTVLQKLKVRNKFELPRILYDDMQSRVLGLVPGDVIEIRRPSPTSGEYIFYRVCSL
jgi:DNA-directed RNA polymerase subunit H (RpoH/RPB5)